jgi:hypothetical protein
MDPLRTIQPGDPILAETMNALTDSARTVRRMTQLGGAGVSGQRGNNVLISVLNATGQNLPKYSVLGIDGPLFTPDENFNEFMLGPAVRGVSPTSAHVDDQKFVILQTPARQDQIVLGCVVGYSIVQIDRKNDADRFAVPVAGETAKMASADEGPARIIWTDGEWALVCIGVAGAGGSTVRSGITQGAFTQANPGRAVKVRLHVPGATPATPPPLGEEIVDAYVPLLHSGGTLPDGLLVYIVSVNGRYEILQGACP